MAASDGATPGRSGRQDWAKVWQRPLLRASETHGGGRLRDCVEKGLKIGGAIMTFAEKFYEIIFRFKKYRFELQSLWLTHAFSKRDNAQKGTCSAWVSYVNDYREATRKYICRGVAARMCPFRGS